jgi:hypothetical protein
MEAMRAISNLAATATIFVLSAGPALAWGDDGHKVVALIAYKHLTPAAKAKVDAILAGDTDTLTAPDFASRATWADKWRNSHRETSEWHFADVELSSGDLNAACFNFPPLPAGTPASLGPKEDCAANKIAQFAAELKDPNTSDDERRFALKFILHFVGDLHQPLHSSDSDDRGGNCVLLTDGPHANLHSFWDTTIVKTLGSSPIDIATKLDAKITKKNLRDWEKGDPKAWTMEAFGLAKAVAYQLPSHSACSDKPAPITLSAAYKKKAGTTVTLQLQRAGIRLAHELNQVLQLDRAD